MNSSVGHQVKLKAGLDPSSATATSRRAICDRDGPPSFAAAGVRTHRSAHGPSTPVTGSHLMMRFVVMRPIGSFRLTGTERDSNPATSVKQPGYKKRSRSHCYEEGSSRGGPP